MLILLETVFIFLFIRWQIGLLLDSWWTAVFVFLCSSFPNNIRLDRIRIQFHVGTFIFDDEIFWYPEVSGIFKRILLLDIIRFIMVPDRATDLLISQVTRVRIIIIRIDHPVCFNSLVRPSIYLSETLVILILFILKMPQSLLYYLSLLFVWTLCLGSFLHEIVCVIVRSSCDLVLMLLMRRCFGSIELWYSLVHFWIVSLVLYISNPYFLKDVFHVLLFLKFCIPDLGSLFALTKRRSTKLISEIINLLTVSHLWSFGVFNLLKFGGKLFLGFGNGIDFSKFFKLILNEFDNIFVWYVIFAIKVSLFDPFKELSSGNGLHSILKLKALKLIFRIFLDSSF